MTSLVLAVRLVLGLIFLAALASKVRGRDAYRGFVGSLAGLPWLPVRLTGALAGAVVLAEAGTVGLLTVPATVPAGLGAAAVTLAAFLTGVAVSTRRGARLPCRCFGSSGAVMGTRHLVRNALLLALALAGLAATAVPAAGVSPAESVLVGGLSLIAAVLVVRLDDLAYLATGRTSGTEYE